VAFVQVKAIAVTTLVGHLVDPLGRSVLTAEGWIQRRADPLTRGGRRTAALECHNRPVRELQDRIGVVTGAASGIGLAVSAAFVGEGMRVVMVDIDKDRLRSHTERLAAAGADVHPVVADVRDPEAVDRVGRAVIDRFGVLHIAVNNAGVVGGGNSWEISLEEWRRVLDVDLWGVIHGVRTFVPLILASGAEGHVVNVASMAAVLALPRLAPYTVAKHGILGLTDVLRAELEALEAPVGASVVMPGMVKTAMNPIGIVEPATVASNVLDAIRRNRPYVFTDDHSTGEVEHRLLAVLTARADVIT
jgi:NAD(P)-dependent dehydrogenase (short-subunit alcohol dehydrogenase family)